MDYLKDIKSFVRSKLVFCGIDIHHNHWNLCFICDGELVEKIRIQSRYDILKSRLLRYEDARQIRLVYEAGFSGYWLYRRLVADGYECIVTPPSKLLKTGDRVKTDKRDAQFLASYLSSGHLKSVYVPPAEVEADRRIVRRRAQLVKRQTRAKNQIKSFLHLQGIRTPDNIKTSWSNRYLQWLEHIRFEYESDNYTLEHLIRSYRIIRQDVAEITRCLRRLSSSNKYRTEYKRITSARGVGLVTAMTFLLEIHNFTRFMNERHFASYLGLTPAQYSSGDKIRLGHITRQGNPNLRRVLTESAWTVIRYDPHLKEKYDRIRKQGANGKKAIVAVARSLAIRLRRCLLDKTDYVLGVC
jgi:transposase